MKICIFRGTPIFSSNYNVQFIHQLIILISFAVRDAKHTNFVEFRNFKIIYRRYAGLYFCICVDVSDNNLFYLEAIHNFVEVLNEYFHNVRPHHMFSRILNFLVVIFLTRKKSCFFKKIAINILAFYKFFTIYNYWSLTDRQGGKEAWCPTHFS